MPERPRPDEERVREALRETSDGADEESPDGPATEDLDEDPAYNPEGSDLKDLKGG